MSSDSQTESTFDESQTLEPPGSIAVVGAGPLGVEAALYGRFLGYDVTVLERASVGSAMLDRADEPIPMIPDRSISSLAVGALDAQYPEQTPRKFPETIGEWVERFLVPLTETDLLRGRVRSGAPVTRIDTIPREADEDDASESGEPVPPDFRLTLARHDDGTETADFEAVMLAIGSNDLPELGFELPTPYFFRIGGRTEGDAEEVLNRGRREIVSAFAKLAGRAGLDLYRPPRL